MTESKWTFNCACALSRETQGFIVGGVQIPPDAKEEDLIPGSSFAVFVRGNWSVHSKLLPGTVIAIAAVRFHEGGMICVAANPTGGIWTYLSKKREETISQIEGCKSVTNLKVIDGHIYACGMGRTLFKRNSDGSWVDISVPKSESTSGITGFTDIIGTSNNEIFAVGWQGEIWKYAPGKGWTQENSPTRKGLNAITVTDNGTLYAVGDSGTLLECISGNWKVIETPIGTAIQDVCFFQNELYISTDFEVIRVGSSAFKPVFPNRDETQKVNCLKLFMSEDNDKLYSFAGANSFYVYSEASWQRIS